MLADLSEGHRTMLVEHLQDKVADGFLSNLLTIKYTSESNIFFEFLCFNNKPVWKRVERHER